MPKKLKLLVIALIVCLGLATAVGVIYSIINRDSSEPAPYQPSELSVPTDYVAPNIEEVKKQFPNPADQYSLFIKYAYAKETVNKIDEAIMYYEAAVDVAPDDESKKATQYTLYLLGNTMQKPELTDKYQQILGNDWIDQYEREKATAPRGDEG